MPEQNDTTEQPDVDQDTRNEQRIIAALERGCRQMEEAGTIRDQFKNHSVHGETTAHMLIALSVQFDALYGLIHEMIDVARIKGKQGEEDER